MSNGLCECGCRRKTPLIARTDNPKGRIKGQPNRFIKGHSGHKFRHREMEKPLDFVERDCGYETPCWLFRNFDPDHYGGFYLGGIWMQAHRFFYERERGPIAPGLHLDYLCRTPACVNPDHLEPVTPGENMRRGSWTKLTRETAAEVWTLCRQGWQQRDIGAAYGVTQAAVSGVACGRTWVDVSNALQAAGLS